VHVFEEEIGRRQQAVARRRLEHGAIVADSDHDARGRRRRLADAPDHCPLGQTLAHRADVERTPASEPSARPGAQDSTRVRR
jgi:hypothetical protein